ncbi:Prostaglandin E synthase 3 (Cytosolic) [Aspergillus nanangensis]|uniref:Prostaglandin E synthase 3 (Cytosolic) n=1 Tax=Aspergillus nanangensis TaxID=2582783 RepID=A0AAD4CSD5_ASPNN|nr:Prostaglandin E synthase 3 (Cytosolic) [Aspergillus nanangensis]
MPDLKVIHPEVTWAQRSSSTEPERNYLYVNIKASDVPKESASLKITPTNVTFAGDSGKGVRYEASLDLYGEIDPENSKVNHSAREVELVLRKKELKEEFWPRLLKTTQKIHFLKTDFDKWVDEDEQDEAPEEDYANNMGGFEGMGGGAGGEGGLGNIDFSKLGAGLEGMGGMPGMEGMGGMPGMPDLASMMAAGGAGGAEGEAEEDMPELEEADAKAQGSAKSSKIEEIP